jgi:hypothetical protein
MYKNPNYSYFGGRAGLPLASGMNESHTCTVLTHTIHFSLTPPPPSPVGGELLQHLSKSGR